jgi:hypothetical protein
MAFLCVLRVLQLQTLEVKLFQPRQLVQQQPVPVPPPQPHQQCLCIEEAHGNAAIWEGESANPDPTAAIQQRSNGRGCIK